LETVQRERKGERKWKGDKDVGRQSQAIEVGDLESARNLLALEREEKPPL
jgi:hypothetical protein